ncbi:MAG: hypothetical protein ACRDPA_21940 [Solirubrobacteraceae bacterium]
MLMLYGDDYYDADSERPGEMDIIVRENRQGRLGQGDDANRQPPSLPPRRARDVKPDSPRGIHRFVAPRAASWQT